MSDINIIYTLIEDVTGDGLYIITVNKLKYIAYIKNKNEFETLKNIKDIIDETLLEQKGIYLLKNIKEIFHNSEEKTKKIIKFLIIDKKIMESDIIKIFIIMIITYLIYQDIYLTAIVKDPTLIDFFENKNNNIKTEILQNLFYYLIEYKGLLSKLNISNKNTQIKECFKIIDERKNIFNKEIIDPQSIINLFNIIEEKFENK
jgi:hypothetical protein